MRKPAKSFGLLMLSMTLFCCSGNGQTQSFEVPPLQQISDQTEAETLIANLNRPWGMVWISSSEVLITERGGTVKRIDLSLNTVQELSGLIPVFSSGQGGLLDVAVHPNFAENSWVYFSFSQGTRDQNHTAVARAQLAGESLTNWETIFEVNDLKSGSQHFGSRLLWLPDQTLLISIGDGGNPPVTLNGQLIREQAQNLQSHLGKVIRLNDDGSIPADNPFTSDSQALPEIWSYGHRNIQGLAIDPQTQKIWASEHGSRGGDELNALDVGANYGWPKVSFSLEYTENRPVAPVTSLEGTISPQWVWTPAIAPSGLAVYRGDKYPQWDGAILVGALRDQSIIRLKVNEEGKAIPQESLPMEQRVRDVRIGPDGFVYVLTDSVDGKLLRLKPVS